MVVATADMKVGVSYTHPDWDTATYDSEDKALIPVMEDISGETEVRIDVNFSMTIAVDEDGQPAEIESVTFRNDRFIYIDLNEDGYPYK
ncbi:hypothetical protein [Pseudaminobacter sp. NGMCC 1.201702]|uniref:hypothetical protein n=1 Tax=Pseudaminobacter sp. NGMCC 1.201702 TaxID=3391825 RepID=UPI0039EFD15A